MNVKGLEALRAFMEEGTLNGAALRLHRTQPQISRLLSALEEEAGFALFSRNKRRLLPTPAAREFYGFAQSALLSLDETKQAARRIRAQQGHHVRILTAPHITNAFLSEAIARMTQEAPDFTAAIDSRTRIDIEVWLGRERFDIGITVLPLEDDSIEVEPMATVPCVAVMNEAHPLATRAVIKIEDLVGVDLVANAPRTVMRQKLESMFLTLGAEPKVRLETPNGFIACELATRGLGVAIADGFVASAAMRPGMVIRQFAPAISNSYVMIFPRTQPRTKTARRMADYLREEAQASAARLFPKD